MNANVIIVAVPNTPPARFKLPRLTPAQFKPLKRTARFAAVLSREAPAQEPNVMRIPVR